MLMMCTQLMSSGRAPEHWLAGRLATQQCNEWSSVSTGSATAMNEDVCLCEGADPVGPSICTFGLPAARFCSTVFITVVQ